MGRQGDSGSERYGLSWLFLAPPVESRRDVVHLFMIIRIQSAEYAFAECRVLAIMTQAEKQSRAYVALS
jgi:hypothetical protein